MTECKFTRWHSGPDELGELRRVSERALLGGENVEYMIFSGSGFTAKLLEAADAAADAKVRLVSMDDIRAWGESREEVRRPLSPSR